MNFEKLQCNFLNFDGKRKMILKDKIKQEMLFQMKNNLLDKWYPKVIDKKDGGYYSNLTYDFKLSKNQDKMIVTQARHIWTLSKAAEFFDDSDYLEFASHGIEFLQNKLWDNNNGGFYQIRDKQGNLSTTEKWLNEKRVYGNAYGLYGLSALYSATKDSYVLKFAHDVFDWIEKFAHDKVHKGYFQFFEEDNSVFDLESEYKSCATDSIEVGYKDQNSSIHLMEAFTEFYAISKSPLLKARLEEILFLIRDKMVTDRGYLQLFFSDDWEPISYKHSPRNVIEANFRLDHISFGHDYETAFLMLEASHALGLKDDVNTLRVAKNMVDHALENGWDKKNGGFFDGGYYFEKDDSCSIIAETKNWWAQAEALNIYLIMSKIFPKEEKYMTTFLKEWEYVKHYIIDSENGGWFWGGIDKEPECKMGPKGEIWKGTYHNGRALMNCIVLLANESHSLYKSSKGFRSLLNKSNEFISHWKQISDKL